MPGAIRAAEIDRLIEARLQPIIARLATMHDRPEPRVGPVRFDPANRGTPRPVIDWPAVRRYFEAGHSTRETAERFDLSINTVKTRSQRDGWVR